MFILMSSTAAEENYYGNIIRPITASIATVLAAVILYRQKFSGLFGKAYAGLTAGLLLWLVAEITWAYYSVGMGIEVPFPSPADAFWLAGYGPLGYHLFRTSGFYRKAKGGRKKIGIIATIVAVYSAFFIYNIVAVSDFASPISATRSAISIAYPVLDAILIVPAIFSILNAGRGELTAVPWIFISWILTAMADSIFGYTAVTNIAGALSIWNLFYNAAYIHGWRPVLVQQILYPRRATPDRAQVA